MEIAYAHTVAPEKDVYVEMMDKVNNIVASLGSTQILLAIPAREQSYPRSLLTMVYHHRYSQTSAKLAPGSWLHSHCQKYVSTVFSPTLC